MSFSDETDIAAWAKDKRARLFVLDSNVVIDVLRSERKDTIPERLLSLAKCASLTSTALLPDIGILEIVAGVADADRERTATETRNAFQRTVGQIAKAVDVPRTRPVAIEFLSPREHRGYIAVFFSLYLRLLKIRLLAQAGIGRKNGVALYELYVRWALEELKYARTLNSSAGLLVRRMRRQ